MGNSKGFAFPARQPDHDTKRGAAGANVVSSGAGKSGKASSELTSPQGGTPQEEPAMIDEKSTTAKFYQVICDECGNTAPGSTIRQEAITLAEEAGFQVSVRWNGLAYVSTYLCPDCYREQEGE